MPGAGPVQWARGMACALLASLVLLLAAPIAEASLPYALRPHAGDGGVGFRALRGGGNCLSGCWSGCMSRLNCGNCLAALDPLSLINMRAAPPRSFMLSSDIDDTLIGERDSLEVFNRAWQEECVGRGCKLVYNTGRSLEDFQAARREWDLLTPDVFIGGCGSQVYTFDAKGYPVLDHAWIERLKIGWGDKATVTAAVETNKVLTERYGKIDQKKESRTNEYMYSCKIVVPEGSSLTVGQAKEDFEGALREAGLNVTIAVASVAYSTESTVTGMQEGESYIFVDVLPAAAGKGAAQVYVRKLLEFDESDVVVAGDSGNDVSMFTTGNERGIMVGNARAELVAVKRPHHTHAKGRCAAGVLEGLRNYGLVKGLAPV